jgi:hypothetical protein
MDSNGSKIEYLVEKERFSEAINTLRVVNKFTHDNLIREIASQDTICDHGKLALGDYSDGVYSDITRLCEEELALVGGYNLDGYSLDTIKQFYIKLADRTLEALQDALPKNFSGVCPICGGPHEIKPLARGIMEDYLNIAISVEANLMREIAEELSDQLLLLNSRIKMEIESTIEDNKA